MAKRRPPCKFTSGPRKGQRCRKVGRGKRRRWMCCRKKR